MRHVLFTAVIFAVGCGKAEREPELAAAPTKSEPRVQPEPAPKPKEVPKKAEAVEPKKKDDPEKKSVSPKAEAFRVAALAYVLEAKSIIRSLDTFSTLPAYARRVEKMDELLSRIPDAEDSKTAEFRNTLKRSAQVIRGFGESIRLAQELADLGKPQDAVENLKKMKAVAIELKSHLDTAEEMLAEAK